MSRLVLRGKGPQIGAYMEVNASDKQGVAYLIGEAYAVSMDVGTEVERAFQDGLEHPMDDEEVARLLTKVLTTLRTEADRRGDEETLRALQGDVSQIVEKIMRGHKRVSIDGESNGVRRASSSLESHGGIEPRAVFPRPIFLGKEVAMMSGFVKTTDIDLWDENERIDIHLKQFEAKHGRRPSREELFDIMTGRTKLPGVTGGDQFKIEQLAASIAANGVRTPPILDVDGTLLDGNRRVTACYHVLGSDAYGLEQKKRAEWIFVWQLTEHRTEEERNAVIVSSNFEPDLKEQWPKYVKAKKVHEEFEKLRDLESMSLNPRPPLELRKEVAQKFGLDKTATVNGFLKMVDWSSRFEDYHINERDRNTYEVMHRAEEAFEYFDELSKGQKPGGVAYALENDDAFRRATFDLLFQDAFKNWTEVRELKNIQANPEARESLIKAPKSDPDVVRERFEEAMSAAKVGKAEKRSVGANTRIETFTKWLEELPLKAFRDDIKHHNLVRLRDALCLANRQVESILGRDQEQR